MRKQRETGSSRAGRAGIALEVKRREALGNSELSLRTRKPLDNLHLLHGRKYELAAYEEVYAIVALDPALEELDWNSGYHCLVVSEVEFHGLEPCAVFLVA